MHIPQKFGSYQLVKLKVEPQMKRYALLCLFFFVYFIFFVFLVLLLFSLHNWFSSFAFFSLESNISF